MVYFSPHALFSQARSQLLLTSNNKRQHIESQKEKGPRLRRSQQVHEGNSSIPGKAITWKQNHCLTNGPWGTQVASCAGRKWESPSPKHQLPSRTLLPLSTSYNMYAFGRGRSRWISVVSTETPLRFYFIITEQAAQLICSGKNDKFSYVITKLKIYTVCAVQLKKSQILHFHINKLVARLFQSLIERK